METKRLLSLLLICLLAFAPAAHAALAPNASVLNDALRGTPYEGYTISCQTFAMQYGEPGNSSAYAIANKDGINVLCAFEENKGDWHLRVANENALPDDPTQLSITIADHSPLVAIKADTAGGSIQLQFVINSYDVNAPYTWPLFEVMNTVSGADGRTPFTVQVAPSEETGKWTITENGEYKSYEDHAYARMEDFDFQEIPLTRADADAIWHGMDKTVYIERDERAAAASLHKLVGREITLPGDQTLPVYSGPGEAYLRGASGKAAVSTNAPLTVYATNFDWVLISYDVSTGERFGYISRSHMLADVSIDHELNSGTMSVGLTTREVAVLDNLSDPDAPLCVLPYQTPLEVYATLGEWLYVGSFSDSGFSCRGFIPMYAFHHTNNF